MSPSDFKRQKLNRLEAKKLITRLLKSGRVVFSSHALERALERGIGIQDALNVLEAPGSKVMGEGELEGGSYSYRVQTNLYTVVVGFTSDGRALVIVTIFSRRSS